MTTTAAVLALVAPFTAPVTLSSGVQSPPDVPPSFASAPDGGAFAAWVEGGAGRPRLADVALDRGGTVTVAWRRTMSSTLGDLVEASRGKAGVGFSSPQRLSTYGRLVTPPAVLAGAGGGRGVVAWASRAFGVGGTQLKVASGPRP